MKNVFAVLLIVFCTTSFAASFEADTNHKALTVVSGNYDASPLAGEYSVGLELPNHELVIVDYGACVSHSVSAGHVSGLTSPKLRVCNLVAAKRRSVDKPLVPDIAID